MARDENGDVAPIYKGSKKQQEAKKGDVKTGKELGDESDDSEYESTGSEMSDEERRTEGNRASGTPDKVEFWRRKKKADIPTS